MTCEHGKEKDHCLICWAEFNNELEALRIASGLSREEFGAVIRKCVEENQKRSEAMAHTKEYFEDLLNALKLAKDSLLRCPWDGKKTTCGCQRCVAERAIAKAEAANRRKKKGGSK